MLLDKTFCASPNCTDKCGRKMSKIEANYFKELAFRGINVSSRISHAYFCDKPTELDADEQTKE